LLEKLASLNKELQSSCAGASAEQAGSAWAVQESFTLPWNTGALGLLHVPAADSAPLTGDDGAMLLLVEDITAIASHHAPGRRGGRVEDSNG
jgi:hypothetical protein